MSRHYGGIGPNAVPMQSTGSHQDPLEPPPAYSESSPQQIRKPKGHRDSVGSFSNETPLSPTYNAPQPSTTAGVATAPLPPRGSRQSPSRRAHIPYLLVRVIGAVMAAVILAFTRKARNLDRGNWVGPCMAPAINGLISHLIDVLLILIFGWKLRSPHTCVWWDGLIGIGYAIGGGFLTAFAVPDIDRSRPDSSPETAKVGLVLSVFMLTESVIHFFVAYTGQRDIERMNRERAVAAPV